MKLSERVLLFTDLFKKLQETTSRTTKEFFVKKFRELYPELSDELTTIFETLDNKHPIGWTMSQNSQTPQIDDTDDITITDLINLCITCPKDYASTQACEQVLGHYTYFLAPIVNRKLRLGIGKSQLEKTVTTPMLAKKYEGGYLRETVTVTEKLDGNRCIAQYLSGRWVFTSRSGKPLAVTFDMTGLPTEFIYDGEVMSVEQTKASARRVYNVLHDIQEEGTYDTKESQLLFNETSGLINSKDLHAGQLIYNIFDIISTTHYAYSQRRDILTEIGKQVPPTNKTIRIIPSLYEGDDPTVITSLLYKIVQQGGEGVMLNINNRTYEHKRTDALLKYKQVQTIDMRVTDMFEGQGKYENMCGGLTCYAKTNDGKEILCNVGSGLSDAQREDWWLHREHIISRIVQIAYHELTQEALYRGTNMYSLRFPRLMMVRRDKNETSEY